MDFLRKENIRIVTVVLCGLLSLCGLLVLSSVAAVMISAGGNCLLYADQRSYGSSSLCAFPIAIATSFHLVYCLARAVFVVIALRGMFGKEYLEHKAFLISCAVADVIACLLTLVSGGIISHGFSVMCSKLFHPNSDICGSVNIYNFASSSFVTDYYVRFNIAEAGVWLGWVLWLVLIACDIFLLWKSDLLSVPALPSLPSFPHVGRRRAGRGSDAPEPGSSGSNVERPPVVAKYKFPPSEKGESGSRTPPPSRPVPPAPGHNKGRVAMTKY